MITAPFVSGVEALPDNITSTSSLISHPIMHGLSSIFVLAALAAQTVLGRPDPSRVKRHELVKRSVDSYIATESPIALQHILCNIGSAGCEAAGASSGVVIASPSQVNPDYWYTWTRDSALTFTALIDTFSNSYNSMLQAEIENYIAAEATLQSTSNPSGALPNGAGLGEPKFNVDLTAFTGSWGRPQRDGPALRSIALIRYANWLITNGYTTTVNEVLWPIINNDLSYVAQYWNQTGFDLWEEIDGSSFFTVASQHQALAAGSQLAKTLGSTCPSCDTVSPSILCFLQSFWSASDGYIIANINVDDGRSGKDANTVLGSIHSFDPTVGCDATTFQPCSDKALANHKVYVDAFRSIYSINSGIPEGTACATGRYPEDVFYNGNPWYLNTLAAAEQLYDALYVWKSQGSIEVTATSLAFFQDFDSSVTAGIYSSSSSTYETLYNAVSAYADGFFNVVATYTPSNGSLSEEFSKTNGAPTSAYDLTWSYAAFLTAAARRAGVMPPSWGAPSGDSLPSSCAATSVVGLYETPSAVSFPPSQTPSSAPATTPASGCVTATVVDVTFNELVTTVPGQTIMIVGTASNLGDWDTGDAVALSASGYTSTNPLWSVTIALQAGEVVEYKYINVQSDGTVDWEADPNHTYTVPQTCATATTVSDTWQS